MTSDEILRRLGALSGCDHVESDGDRARLVRCIEEAFGALRARAEAAEKGRVILQLECSEWEERWAAVRSQAPAPDPAAAERERLGRIAWEAAFRREPYGWSDVEEPIREMWRKTAEAVVAAATPPAPAAIVVVWDAETKDVHAFGDIDDAEAFADSGVGESTEITYADPWTWHPRGSKP